MPAQHSIHPEQLKLFMSANEIMQHYQALDADLDPLESHGELWHRKYNEAWDEGMVHDIEMKGVEKPVSLGTEVGSQDKPQILGGHHRIAVMKNESPDKLMPVLHYKNMAQVTKQTIDRFNGRGGYTYT